MKTGLPLILKSIFRDNIKHYSLIVKLEMRKSQDYPVLWNISQAQAVRLSTAKLKLPKIDHPAYDEKLFYWIKKLGNSSELTGKCFCSII